MSEKFKRLLFANLEEVHPTTFGSIKTECVWKAPFKTKEGTGPSGGDAWYLKMFFASTKFGDNTAE